MSHQSFANRRISKEIARLKKPGPPTGITWINDDRDNLTECFMKIQVLDANPIYLNETYYLRFRFSSKYPIEAPEVMFVTIVPGKDLPRTRIPMHPHIYSNGIICLDLLDKSGWSPVQSVESVCMSLQSILTGNTRNERPEGDEDFCRYNRKRPRDINFHFEDDGV